MEGEDYCQVIRIMRYWRKEEKSYEQNKSKMGKYSGEIKRAEEE